MAKKSTIRAYKYKSLEIIDHCIDIIENDRLYCAPFTTLNDPNEGQYYYLEDEERAEAITQRVDNIMGEKGKFRICSLSKSKCNQSMLSSYADEHRGCIIEVELRYSSNVFDVQYVSKLPEVDVLQGKQKEIARSILRKKLSDFKHENEIRVLAEQEFFSLHSKVVSVAFGSRATEENISQISDICDRRSIAYHTL